MISEKRRIRLAKSIDEFAGRFLTSVLAARGGLSHRAAGCEKPDRILFIKFWGMGSVVLTEPTLDWIQRVHPQAEVHYLTLERNRPLLEMIPHVARIHTIRFRSFIEFVTSSLRTLRRLRREQFDLVLDAEFFCNFSVLVARTVSGRNVIAGFSRPGSYKARIHDVSIPFRNDLHVSLQFLRLARAGTRCLERRPGVGDSAPRPRLTPGPSAHHSVRAVRAGSRPYIVVNVNASALATERRWPRKSFVHLCRALLDHYGCALVLTGTKTEVPYVDTVRSALGRPERVHDLSGHLTVRDLVSLLAGAVCLISSDSGPVHLASAVDAPVAVFFGPETPRLYGPLSSRQIVFFQNLWCSPCMSVDNAKTVHCINQQLCMRTMHPEAVFSALRPFLDDALSPTHEAVPAASVGRRLPLLGAGRAAVP